MKWKTKSDLRTRRHFRLRRKIEGSPACPRMAIFRSNRHIYVQFIDDLNAVTLSSASTLAGDGGDKTKACTVDMAKALGKRAAEKAREQGIERVVFDRGGFKYGGRIQALADAAREGGLQF